MLLTVAEAAAARNTTRVSIHRWIASGLPFKWLEGKRVIDADELKNFQPRQVGNPNFRFKHRPHKR